MPTTIFANSNDGVIFKNTGTHANSRDATTGTANSTGTFSTVGAAYQRGSKGGVFYIVYRSFFYFDTSGITSTVSAATLNLYGLTNGTGDVIAVKSTAFGGDGGTALANDDFNNVDFSTAYSGEVSTWSTSGYNEITLNSTAKTDIENNDYFIVAVINYDLDFLDVDPGINVAANNGFYFTDYTGTSRDPKLIVTTGYSNSVIGTNNIASVKGVEVGNISQIIGV